jgi:hypothetical protein
MPTANTNNGYGQAKFAGAFGEVPVINWSVSGRKASNNDYQEYVPFSPFVTKEDAGVTAIEVRGRQAAGPASISYIAIGKPPQ